VFLDNNCEIELEIDSLLFAMCACCVTNILIYCFVGS